MDPIANMLTQIRNATMLKKEEILVPHSRVKVAIAEILKQNHYLKAVEVIETEAGRKMLRLVLRYSDGESAIRSLRRISKPGLRMYVKATHIPRPRGGYGHIIISTPQGFMTGNDARKRAIGGEVICEVLS